MKIDFNIKHCLFQKLGISCALAHAYAAFVIALAALVFASRAKAITKTYNVPTSVQIKPRKDIINDCQGNDNKITFKFRPVFELGFPT